MILAGANAAEGRHSSAADGRRRDRVFDPCAFLIGPDQLRPCRAETLRIRGRQAIVHDPTRGRARAPFRARVSVPGPILFLAFAQERVELLH